MDKHSKPEISKTAETTMHPALAGKKLTIRDLQQVAGGQRPDQIKSKVSDGGYTSESAG